ncbi:hypothetical protein I0P70_01390 [Pontibacter sp. FD36]|uniref:hypothetical protein n=1 Tax=Pontibacter sp. FD36 TaxID=2789860 RepID=UPI0018A8FDEF|nr:hypothetical protein [Pontibacter sp. FD36]MBF8961884.1 hypothetical protein [Pontibacter sp. FD36]
MPSTSYFTFARRTSVPDFYLPAPSLTIRFAWRFILLRSIFANLAGYHLSNQKLSLALIR